MKILILSTKMPWPAKDGGSIASLNLARGLAELDCQITFLTMNTPKHFFPSEKIPEKIRDLIDIRTVSVNTAISPIALFYNFLFSSYPYIARRFISSEFSRELVKCLKSEKYDIIQLEGPYLGWYIPAIRRYSSARVALRAHNLEHIIWKQTAHHEPGIIRKLYLNNLAKRILKLERGLLKKIDLLVPISKTDARDFREIYDGIPIHTCPPGIDIASYSLGENTDIIKLFFIGALDWGPNRQGLDWFFRDVWPKLVRKWPDLQISLAGRNASDYFKQISIPQNVSPWVEVQNSMDFFNEHNVMIVPLLSGSGVRIKIIEAMAMGKIVISTTTGASGIAAKDGEHLFIADTSDEYIKIIQLIMGKPSLHKTIGKKARSLVIENFDNLAIADKLISFYLEQLR
jgi:polysaccharide biosynthesis protein PslH